MSNTVFGVDAYGASGNSAVVFSSSASYPIMLKVNLWAWGISDNVTAAIALISVPHGGTATWTVSSSPNVQINVTSGSLLDTFCCVGIPTTTFNLPIVNGVLLVPANTDIVLVVYSNATGSSQLNFIMGVGNLTAGYNGTNTFGLVSPFSSIYGPGSSVVGVQSLKSLNLPTAGGLQVCPSNFD